MCSIFRAGLVLALFSFHPALSQQLTYSTYLSGSAAQAIAVDSSGNSYLGLDGSIVKLDPSGAHLLATYSLPDVKVVALALDAAGNLFAGVTAITAAGPGSVCCSVLKFDSTGKQTVVASVLSLVSLAIDAAGDVYVAGTTVSARPPSTAPITEVTVTKITPAGNTIYSYSFGGSQNSTPRAIAVDSAGDAWVAGDTLAPDLPVTANAAQSKFGGGAGAPGYGSFGDAFLAKIDPAGSKLLYCTYWGGSSADVAYGLTVDSAGAAYIAGATSSPDFPVTAGAFQAKYAGPAANPAAPSPAGDAFVSKFSSSGAALWSTYWGGASADVAYALALDASGGVYIAGTTESFSDFPRAGASIPTCRQTGGPFVAVLDPSGSKLLHSTGLPGISYDNVYALALDSTGAAYIAGSAESEAFLATPGALQTTFPSGITQNPYAGFAARVDFSQSTGLFPACLLNAASFAAGNTAVFPNGAVAPGEIVSVFGTGLAGARIAFDGVAAPILYSGATQINAIVPYELTSSATQLTLTYNSQSYGPITLPVAAAVPGIFTATQTGYGQAAVVNQDGTLNSIANPAARGSLISLYLTGVGQLSPAQSDGAVSPPLLPLPAPALPVIAGISGVNAAVQYAGAAPGYVSGLIQINVLVPTSINFGNLVPLMVSVGTYNSQPGVTIALK